MRPVWRSRSARHGAQPSRRAPSRTRRVVEGVVASAVAILGLVAFSTPAFAHDNIVSASGACADPLGTGYKVTWTIANDYNATESGSVTSVTGGLATLSATTFSIAASPHTPYSTTTLTQTLPASASGSVTLNISSTWSDGYSRTDQGTFDLSSLKCAAPTQTIAGHIYLCNNGNPTTTEETGGTLAAGGTGLSSVGPTPNPLAPTNVVAGTYTMNATSPPGFLIVTCGGGSWTPVGTSASHSVVVPTGLTGVGTFYVVSFAPQITLAKSADVSSYSAPGATVTYSYLVKNTGNVTLNPVTVTDPMTGLSAVTCPHIALASGQNETCTATYTTTQADVDNGTISNTGTATGSPPWGPKVTATDSHSIPAAQSPAITMHKTASVTSFAVSGVPVTYFYAVKNTGNVTLTGVQVTDPMSGLSAVSCPESTLAPGASESCTATYATTLGDVEHGSLDNIGTASGHGGGKTVTAESSLSIPAVQSPAISVVKTADVPSVSAVGQQVTYAFTVTNSGNVTLDNVDVTDAQVSPSLDASLGPITCTTGTNGSITLAPGASDSCRATYTVTKADLAEGSVTDTATVTGDPVTEGKQVSATATLTLSVQAMTVTKSAGPSGGVVAGSTTPIVYTITAQNTGAATTSAATVVTDAPPTGTTLVSSSPGCTGGPPTCTVALSGSTITWTIPAGVAPGASYTLTFSVTANASDATGTITNTGAWTGPGCGAVGSTTPCPTDPASTPVTAAPTTNPSTGGSTTGATTATTTALAVTAPATTSSLAFTGAPLTVEWMVGLGILLVGAGLVAVARRNHRTPQHARRPQHAAPKK